ncbi:HAD-IA family hydrolase [Streptomyces sp. NBS 14/10]|uniref:HAD-IA family hydrolase n=1 Tax=Streptomyces sp. NBS 14/10 TaxID=1945643 RepID=UPI001C528627|nr:HAD-IA family hydrolase [Streptomyces sp. NBS 14/10]KAK1184386.1 HAD-IA family hydrolase [Streptomyces sp. NBS 14/10]
MIWGFDAYSTKGWQAMARITRHALRCSAVLLDLDGVLVESGHSVERSWRAWALRNDLDPEQVQALCHGRRSVETIAALAPSLDAQAEAWRLESEQAADQAELEACHGARQLVEAMPSRRWAVVTSGSRQLALSRLRTAGIPVPNVLVTADDVRRGKPSPEGYLAAAEKLGIPAAQCTVIEDTNPGVQAARAAGCTVIGILGDQLGPLHSLEIAVRTLADLRIRREGTFLHLTTTGGAGAI